MVTDRHEFASRSKYGELHLVSVERAVEEVVRTILLKHGQNLLAVATDEHYLNLVLRYQPGLHEQFNWLMPERKTALRLLRKKTAYELCRACRIPVPAVYKLEEMLTSDRPEAYPLVAKRDAYLERTQKAGLPKYTVLQTRMEIEAFASKYALVKEDILLQQKLSDSFRSVSVAGFFLQGVTRCLIAVEQVRQYPSGVTCFAREAGECRWSKLVQEYIRRFAEHTGYTGFLEMEFKTDGEQVWLLDINPRLWKWMNILKAKYPGFPHQLLSVVPMEANGKRAVWADPFRDLPAMLKEHSVCGLLDYKFGMTLYMVDFRDWGPYSFLWRR